MKFILHLPIQPRNFYYGFLVCCLSIFLVITYQYDTHYLTARCQHAIKQLRLSRNTLSTATREFENRLASHRHNRTSQQQLLKQLTKKSSNDFIIIFNQTALQALLTITHIKPGPRHQSATLTFQTLQVEATGNYQQFFHFLLALSRLPMVIVIQAMDIAADAHHHLVISLTLAIASV